MSKLIPPQKTATEKKKNQLITKQHYVYLAVAIFLILFFAYEFYQTRQIKNLLASEVSQLLQEISSLQRTADELNLNLSTASQKITTLNASIEQKQQQISSLDKELGRLQTESQQQLGELEDKITQLKLQNQDFSEVIDESIPAVVSIRTNVGSGSGFLVRKNGYIVTNNHVIEGATAATIVTSDEKEHSVFLVGKNSAADIAVVKIDGSDYSWLGFADSDKIIVGEKVIAIGNPGGLDFTVTQGIVSAAHREDSAGNSFVQIDVPINPGNSGGPLLNAAGKVVGVTTKKISGFEGVGFAIESNQVREIVEGMIEEYEASLETR